MISIEIHPKVKMETSSIRPATLDDLSQMVEIENISYPEPWQQSHFENEMKKPFARVLVMTDDETDEKVQGQIIYWVHAEEVSLLNIAVALAFRAQGVGMRLMQAMINEAVRDEIPKIILEVRPSNSSAVFLYQKLGFKLTHERPDFYSDGEKAWVMELKTSDLSGMIQ